MRRSIPDQQTLDVIRDAHADSIKRRPVNWPSSALHFQVRCNDVDDDFNNVGKGQPERHLAPIGGLDLVNIEH